MDKTFQKFLRYSIDLSPVGVERCADNPPYFCMPRGASVFGWAGMDGIHFCFIRGFDGMVFAVSPMNAAPDFVHPLAKDFADFLRLLLASGNVATPFPELNGKIMQASHGCAVSFNPCLSEGEENDADAKWVMEHYNLEASHGWCGRTVQHLVRRRHTGGYSCCLFLVAF